MNDNTTDLPMDKPSKMKRAIEMGFTTRAFHGTGAKFNEFDVEKGTANHSGFAPNFANIKGEAEGYANDQENGRVLSVLLRIRKPLIVPDTWGVMPKDVPQTDPDTYRLITGGEGHLDNKRERGLHNYDAIEHAMDVHYANTGNFDRREIWTGIYGRLKSQGYDAIIWKDVRADHTNGRYDKIVMLDMTGIRLITAKFDPAQSNSRDIRS